MNNWDKTRQDDKFKKKLQNVKSTMHKRISKFYKLYILK